MVLNGTKNEVKGYGTMTWNRKKMHIWYQNRVSLKASTKTGKNIHYYENTTTHFVVSTISSRLSSPFDWHLPGCQSLMTTVTTVSQGTAVSVQPCLFEPSDSNSDQETDSRASEKTEQKLYILTEWSIGSSYDDFLLAINTFRLQIKPWLC